MSRHEIRLRRHKLTARGTERFRNYGAVLEQHQREVRLKKILRVFTMLLITFILIMLIVILSRVEKKKELPGPRTKAQGIELKIPTRQI